MTKILFKVIGIFFIGAIGGFLFQVFFFSHLVNIDFFQSFQFVKDLKEREVIINPKEEIIIRENVALERAVENIKKTVVGIKTKTREGKTLEGSGLIVTSDGLLVALAELIPIYSNFEIFIENEKVTGEVIKRDISKNLVLIKVNKIDLSTSSFADFGKLKLGERVFLLGIFFDNKKVPQKIVNEGIVRFFNTDYIETNIFEDNILKGSVLFNIDGSVLGLNTINKEGRIIAISVEEIKSFSGF